MKQIEILRLLDLIILGHLIISTRIRKGYAERNFLSNQSTKHAQNELPLQQVWISCQRSSTS